MLGSAGCSRQYESEKYLYKAIKTARKVLLAPETALPFEFDKAIGAYQFIIDNYSDTLSAKRARIAIGSLHLAKKENAKARDIFNNTLRIYPNDRNMKLEILFSIGKSYENEGDWRKAVTVYKKIMREYANTDIALGIPLYIIRYFKKEKNAEEITKAYQEAIQYYKAIADKKEKEEYGFKAQGFIVRVYIEQEAWEEAVNSLEKLITDYPWAANVGLSIRMMEDISIGKLENKDRVVKFIENFVAGHSKHPLAESLKKEIVNLKNVQVGK